MNEAPGHAATSPGEIPEERSRLSEAAYDLIGSLRQVIGTLLSEDRLRIERVAEIEGLHVRALQRRLERNGVTYKELVDQTRFEAATRSLKEPGATVTDIAFDLGYTDVAHFTRAFRRWTGVPPREYRRRRLAM